MYDLYQRYLSTFRQLEGDTLCLLTTYLNPDHLASGVLPSPKENHRQLHPSSAQWGKRSAGHREMSPIASTFGLL
jgi:hypothetical protein